MTYRSSRLLTPPGTGAYSWCRIVDNELMSIGGLLDVPAGPERWESVYGMMEGYIRDFSPDVIHAHNLHYFSRTTPRRWECCRKVRHTHRTDHP